MRARPVIAAVGHVALAVRDLDGAVAQATDVLGLARRSGTADAVDLTHGTPRHSLQLRRSPVDVLDHVGLEAADRDALDEIRGRLRAAGHPLLSESPLDEGIDAGFAVEAPGGVVFEIYTGMTGGPAPLPSGGVRPTRFGHVNFAVPETGPLIAFLEDMLDFRISDRFRGGAFTRCNAEHHGIGVLNGRGTLHHHAWEVQSIADLGRLGDLLDDRGEQLLTGPVRHGMGNNIAAYFAGVGGEVVEYYTDMLRIWDEESYEPGDWPETGSRWYSRWSPALPDPAIQQMGIGLPEPRVTAGGVPS